MEVVAVRASTPMEEPFHQIPSPPPTCKRPRFPEGHPPERLSKKADLKEESASPGDVIADLSSSQESLQSNHSDNSSQEPVNHGACSTPETDITDSAVSDHGQHYSGSIDHQVTYLAKASIPFKFLALPRRVRMRIYGYLLTIPDLVCMRQNQSPHSNEPKAYVYAEQRELLPGMAYVLTKGTVEGSKSRFHRHPFVNAAILRVNYKIFSEAVEVLYGANRFQLFNHTPETSPPVNYRIPLFPQGYKRLVRHITLSAYNMYGFRYIVKGGHQDLKTVYRGIKHLTLVLELESLDKNYGKQFARNDNERWAPYVKRLHSILQNEIFGCPGITRTVPHWVALNVRFSGDKYIRENSNVSKLCPRWKLQKAMMEAFDMFKRK